MPNFSHSYRAATIFGELGLRVGECDLTMVLMLEWKCKSKKIIIYFEKQKHIIAFSVLGSKTLIRMIGYVGEFEELVLLTIAALGESAYGVSIKEDIEHRTDRAVSIGALHSTITRLEEKGFLKSRMGEPTQERGGRRKRYFQLTNKGKTVLRHVKALRDELWDLSKVNLAFSA